MVKAVPVRFPFGDAASKHLMAGETMQKAAKHILFEYLFDDQIKFVLVIISFIFDNQTINMKKLGKFILLDLDELRVWLSEYKQIRPITHIQQHHTWRPNYKLFNMNNHFKLCDSMERDHIKRNLGQIAQNFTTFPDGLIMVCRDLNIQPTGIAKANGGGICIENVGDFDINKDVMTEAQRNTIIELTKMLLVKYKLIPNEKTLVYHHWYNPKTGQRKTADEPNSEKTCPGTNFFGGNTRKDYINHFLPLFT